MEDFGFQKLRIGDIIGDLFEVEQQALPVQTHICPKCGNLELTATDETRAKLLARKGLKKCVACGEKVPLASETCPYCGANQKEADKR
jgi:ribosomal protein S27AE